MSTRTDKPTTPSFRALRSIHLDLRSWTMKSSKPFPEIREHPDTIKKNNKLNSCGFKTMRAIFCDVIFFCLIALGWNSNSILMKFLYCYKLNFFRSVSSDLGVREVREVADPPARATRSGFPLRRTGWSRWWHQPLRRWRQVWSLITHFTLTFGTYENTL